MAPAACRLARALLCLILLLTLYSLYQLILCSTKFIIFQCAREGRQQLKAERLQNRTETLAETLRSQFA